MKAVFDGLKQETNYSELYLYTNVTEDSYSLRKVISILQQSPESCY